MPKRRLKKWVKLLIALIIFTIISAAVLIVSRMLKSSKPEPPQIEYGVIKEVDLK